MRLLIRIYPLDGCSGELFKAVKSTVEEDMQDEPDYTPSMVKAQLVLRRKDAAEDASVRKDSWH